VFENAASHVHPVPAKAARPVFHGQGPECVNNLPAQGENYRPGNAKVCENHFPEPLPLFFSINPYLNPHIAQAQTLQPLGNVAARFQRNQCRPDPDYAVSGQFGQLITISG
jgi:hypothetical protein